MIKHAVADDYYMHYLSNLSQDAVFSIGLILGQHLRDREQIIHFTTTQADDKDVPWKSMEDVTENIIIEHTKHVTRMLPGGMFVLGIFTVSNDDLLYVFHPKLKSLLTNIYKALIPHQYLFGNQELNERLAINYVRSTGKITSKSYDIQKGSVKPSVLKFSSQIASKWTSIRCQYVIDWLFDIARNDPSLTFKNHMESIMRAIYDSLEESVFVVNERVRNANQPMDDIRSSPKSVYHKSNQDEDITITVLQRMDTVKVPETIVSYQLNQIHLLGQVASRIYVSSETTVDVATQFLIQDIMRSISTRLEMHWDSLTEEEEQGSVGDNYSIHEPPRRVFITLPHSGKVCISDYLFPGEGVQEIHQSLEEMMHLKIRRKSEFEDMEGQADLQRYNKSLSALDEAATKLDSTTAKDTNKHATIKYIKHIMLEYSPQPMTLYLLGIAVILLMMAITIQYLM